jgi:ribosome-binding protein aMBF1 (putative translation factor)
VKKQAKKKSAPRRVVLKRRKSEESPGKVGGRERTTELAEWPRVGRRPADEAAFLLDLAEEFKSLREAKGISIAQLAKRTNTAPATLIKFEDRASKIPLTLLAEICTEIGAKLKIVKE